MFYLVDFCRLCLNFQGEFSNMCNDNIMEKAVACISDLEFEDHLPALICLECLEKLDMFFDFRSRCLKSEFLLNSYIEKCVTNTKTKFNNAKLQVTILKNVDTTATDLNFEVESSKKINSDCNTDDTVKSSTLQCKTVTSATLTSANNLQNSDFNPYSCIFNEGDTLVEEEAEDQNIHQKVASINLGILKRKSNNPENGASKRLKLNVNTACNSDENKFDELNSQVKSSSKNPVQLYGVASLNQLELKPVQSDVPKNVKELQCLRHNLELCKECGNNPTWNVKPISFKALNIGIPRIPTPTLPLLDTQQGIATTTDYENDITAHHITSPSKNPKEKNNVPVHPQKTIATIADYENDIGIHGITLPKHSNIAETPADILDKTTGQNRQQSLLKRGARNMGKQKSPVNVQKATCKINIASQTNTKSQVRSSSNRVNNFKKQDCNIRFLPPTTVESQDPLTGIKIINVCLTDDTKTSLPVTSQNISSVCANVNSKNEKGCTIPLVLLKTNNNPLMNIKITDVCTLMEVTKTVLPVKSQNISLLRTNINSKKTPTSKINKSITIPLVPQDTINTQNSILMDSSVPLTNVQFSEGCSLMSNRKTVLPVISQNVDRKQTSVLKNKRDFTIPLVPLETINKQGYGLAKCPKPSTNTQNISVCASGSSERTPLSKNEEGLTIPLVPLATNDKQNYTFAESTEPLTYIQIVDVSTLMDNMVPLKTINKQDFTSDESSEPLTNIKITNVCTLTDDVQTDLNQDT